jgi:hypothetical protein
MAEFEPLVDLKSLLQGCFAGEIWGGGGEFPPQIPNPPPNLKIAKKSSGGSIPPPQKKRGNMNIIINIKLVSGKAYNLEYKNE